LFAALIFWQFSENNKKLVPRLLFWFSIRFCVFTTSEEPNNTIIPKQVSPGRCLEGNFGGDDGWDKSIDFRITLWGAAKNREGNYLVCL